MTQANREEDDINFKRSKTFPTSAPRAFAAPSLGPTAAIPEYTRIRLSFANLASPSGQGFLGYLTVTGSFEVKMLPLTTVSSFLQTWIWGSSQQLKTVGAPFVVLAQIEPPINGIAPVDVLEDDNKNGNLKAIQSSNNFLYRSQGGGNSLVLTSQGLNNSPVWANRDLIKSGILPVAGSTITFELV